MENNFLDELLKEAEEQEQKISREYADLILLEIKNLESEIEKNFEQAEREREIIKNWAIRKNSSLQSRIEFMEKKLELFLKEEGLKTLELSFGTIRFRKSPDRVEITDLTEFLKKADASMLNKVPEIYKADLNKIKAFISRTSKIPTGCSLITGEVKFSYTINKSEDQSNGKQQSEARPGGESATDLRTAV